MPGQLSLATTLRRQSLRQQRERQRMQEAIVSYSSTSTTPFLELSVPPSDSDSELDVAHTPPRSDSTIPLRPSTGTPFRNGVRPRPTAPFTPAYFPVDPSSHTSPERRAFPVPARLTPCPSASPSPPLSQLPRTRARSQSPLPLRQVRRRVQESEVEDSPEVEEAWRAIQPDAVLQDKLPNVREVVISQAHVVIREGAICARHSYNMIACKIVDETLYIVGVSDKTREGWTVVKTDHVFLHSDALETITVQSRYWTVDAEKASDTYEYVGYYISTPPNVRTYTFEHGVVEILTPLQCDYIYFKHSVNVLCLCEVAVAARVKTVTFVKANVFACSAFFECEEVMLEHTAIDSIRLPNVKRVVLRNDSKLRIHKDYFNSNADVDLGARCSYSVFD